MRHYDPEQGFPYQNSLGYLLHQAGLLKDRILDRHLAPLDVTSAQFKVLIYLHFGGVQNPAELCRQLHLDSGAMTRMLDRLESKGLIERKRCPSDRRVVRLSLTPAGLDVAHKIPEVTVNALNELTAPLDQDEFNALVKGLWKLLGPAGIMAPEAQDNPRIPPNQDKSNERE